MLRIRRESKKTENHRVQRLPTLKRWKRGDDNELESNLRLDKVVTSKQLRLAMEIEDERARLENDALQTAQVSHGDRRRKKSKTGEDGSSHTAQVGPRSRG